MKATKFFAFDNTNWTPELEALHSSVDGLQGLRPGDVLVYDFRMEDAPTCTTETIPAPTPSQQKPLKVVQWNIERGYKLEGILKELAALDADVILLQELDISCERSKFANVPLALAKGLGVLCAFVCEFHELPSTEMCKRNADSESGCGFGFHGNAILTKRHALHSLRAFEHSVGLDWAKCGWARREPRLGTRYVLTGCVDVCDGRAVTSNTTPQNLSIADASSAGHKAPSNGSFPTVSGGVTVTNSKHFTRIQLYTLHLEIFCGPLMRLRQLSDALLDAKLCRRRFYTTGGDGQTESRTTSLAGPPANAAATTEGESCPLDAYAVKDTERCPYITSPGCSKSVPPSQRHFAVVIGGDLNTIMHGIVRFSNLYSDDRTKWMSLGETEAEWLQRKVFALPKGSQGKRLQSVGARAPAAESPITREERNALLDTRNQSWLQWATHLYWRYCYGLAVEHVARLSNEELKLYDAFDKLKDITLDNPVYKGYVTGKLDWLLLSNLKVSSKAIGNNDYSLSDHKYLVNEVLIPPFLRRLPTARATGDVDSPAEAAGSAVGNGSFFWADDSLAAAYNSSRDRRSRLTTATRVAYVGVAAALALLVPYKCYKLLGKQ